jgi:hypothetical protein
MKTSHTPVISISRPPAQPKRDSPVITIRTSTFVELLGHAREWDLKFPALASASRAYLLESFAFADSFCSFATQEERRRPGGFIRLAVALIAVLFFALVPVRGEAQQTISAYMTGQEYLPDWPGVIWYAAYNSDPNVTVDVISVSGINSSAVSTNWPYGWWPLNMNNEITWVCYDADYCIQPGQALGGFIVAASSGDFTNDASYLVCGNCTVEDDSGGVAWGTTLGHAQ